MFCFVFLFFSKIKVPFETFNFVSSELFANCFSYLDQRGDGTWAQLPAGIGPWESEMTMNVDSFFSELFI